MAMFNELNLEGKVALVCGASQGIGAACAVVLAQLGATVQLFARDSARLEQTLIKLPTDAGQKHGFLQADFSDPSEVQAEITRFLKVAGSPHILVNNTGGPAPGVVNAASVDAFRAAFEQHLINNHLLAQALLPGMIECGYGRIINVVSTSVKQPLPNLGVSNTIRGAVANWAKTLAMEVASAGITVNNVLPGATATGRLDAIFQNKAKKQDKTVEVVIEHEKASIPAGRFGKPEEVANAVAFLASPAAAYINGINLPVDGGRTSCL